MRDVAIGGLKSALEARGGVSKARSLFARDPSDIHICCELSDEDGGLPVEIRACFNQESGGIQQLRPVVKSEKVWKDSDLIYDRAQTVDASDKDLAASTALEQPLGRGPFNDVVDFLLKRALPAPRSADCQVVSRILAGQAG